MLKNKNYLSLFSLRLLKHTILIFTDSFPLLYFLQLSNNNIIPLGIYYLISYITVYLTIFLLRNFCYSKKRIFLLRIGIFLNLLYFLTIIILNKEIINYMYLLGVIYGLEEGFYYSVFNNFESNAIANTDRHKFIGVYSSISQIISIIIPLIFGAVINSNGFSESAIIIIFLVIFQIISSFIFEDHIRRTEKRVNLKEYIQLVKNNKLLKQVFKNNILNGMIYDGAFKVIINIYIIRVFSDNLSLGIFTSIFAIISSLIGILFAKVIKEKQYPIMIKLATLFTIISLYVLMIKCNFITIIIFNLISSFTKTITTLIIEVANSNISNTKEIKAKYKVQYFLQIETSLVIGRVSSYLIFIVLGLTTSKLFNNLILSIFVIVILFLGDALLSTYKIYRQNDKKIINKG